MFYSALHYVDAYLATQKEYPKSHKRRLDAVATRTSLKQDYSSLYERSMDARYRMVSFTPEIADTIKAGSFHRVKE